MALTPEKLAWIQTKRKLKQRYVFLQDKDLKYEVSQKDEMVAKLSKRLGKTKTQLEEIMESL